MGASLFARATLPRRQVIEDHRGYLVLPLGRGAGSTPVGFLFTRQAERGQVQVHLVHTGSGEFRGVVRELGHLMITQKSCKSSAPLGGVFFEDN